jgi:hypothetical protein
VSGSSWSKEIPNSSSGKFGECCCNNPQLVAYLIHVRKLEKQFDVLELQHVPREGNSAADALCAKAST